MGCTVPSYRGSNGVVGEGSCQLLSWQRSPSCWQALSRGRSHVCDVTERSPGKESPSSQSSDCKRVEREKEAPCVSLQFFSLVDNNAIL